MKNFKKKYTMNKNKITSVIVCTILIYVLFLSVGFATFSTTLNIDAMAFIKVQDDIMVTKVSAISGTNGASSNFENYNIHNITSTVNLPNANSTMTYRIEVTNIGNVEQGIYEINEIYKHIDESINYDLEIKNKTIDLKESLCDDDNNNQCYSGSITSFDITIGYKDGGYDGVNLTHLIQLDFDFRRMFNITYVGFSGNTSELPNKIIYGDTKSITFDNTSGIPSAVVVSGASGSYTNPTLTLSDVTIQNTVDSIVITKAFLINYEGFTGNTDSLKSKIIASGGTITFNSTSGIPTSVTITGGATGSYTSPVLTINSGVTDNITITASFNGGASTPIEDSTTQTYDPNNIPPNSNIIYTAIDGAPQVTTDGDGNVTSFEFTDASLTNPVVISDSQPLSTGFIPFDGTSDWELNMKFKYSSEENSSTSAAKTITILSCADWSTGSMTSGFSFKFYNFRNKNGNTYYYNGMLKYRPLLQIENEGSVTTRYDMFIPADSNNSGIFMTSPMVYTIKITKIGNNITFDLYNGSELTYNSTNNNKKPTPSVAPPDSKATISWQDNISSSDVDITLGAYMSSSGVLSQQANMDIYSFSVKKTN